MPKGLQLTPVGGAAGISLLRDALTSVSDEVYVLSRRRPEEEGDDPHSIWIGEGLVDPLEDDVDLEDLLCPALYRQCVVFGYRNELGGEALELDSNIPGVVARYDAAFRALGVEFRRSYAARLMLKGAVKSPKALLSEEAADRFARLFEAIRSRL